MKYLWNLVLGEKRRGFTYYECTPEVEKNYGHATPDTMVKSYSPGHSKIKPIFEAATKLSEVLNHNLSEQCLYISRNLKTVTVTYKCGCFEAKYENDTVKIRTENGWFFTKEQIDAFFEFVDLLIKHNWFN